MKQIRPQTISAQTTPAPAAPSDPADSGILLAALALSRRDVEAPVGAAAAPALMSRHVALGLPLTRVFHPEVNQLLETRRNRLATGSPIVSRAVIYNNSADDNYRVTYAVDVYADVQSAKAACRPWH